MPTKHTQVTGTDNPAYQVSVGEWNTAHLDYVAPPGTIVSAADYDTVQDAIDAASSGTTIFVPAGTYTEDITCKDGVNLVGPSFKGIHERDVNPTAIIAGSVMPASNMYFADIKMGATDKIFGWNTTSSPTAPVTVENVTCIRCRFTGTSTLGTVVFQANYIGASKFRWERCYFDTPTGAGEINTISVYGAMGSSSVGRGAESLVEALVFERCHFAPSKRFHIETYQMQGTLALNWTQPEGWRLLRVTDCYFGVADYAAISLVSSREGLSGELSLESTTQRNMPWPAGHAEVDHCTFAGWGSAAHSEAGIIELNGVTNCHVHHNSCVASTGYEAQIFNGSVGMTAGTPAGAEYPRDASGTLNADYYLASRHLVEHNYFDGRASATSNAGWRGAQIHSSHNTYLTRGDSIFLSVIDSVFEFDSITRYYRDAVTFAANYTAGVGEMDVTLAGLGKSVERGDYLIDASGYRYFIYAVGTASGSAPNLTQTVSIVRGLRVDVTSGDAATVESLAKGISGVAVGYAAHLAECNRVKFNNCVFKSNHAATVYAHDSWGAGAATTEVAFDSCVFYGDTGFDAVLWAAGSSGTEVNNREITLA